jgi:hypothetical protein
MRSRCMWSVAASLTVLALSPLISAQNTKAGTAKSPAGGGTFDPHDLTGKWHRSSVFQTYSNVPGGANELQAFLLGQAKEPRKLNVPTAEAPFTPEGQAAFDKNVPSYGRRIAAPRVGNDPQGMCDPWGVPRMLNGQVAGVHSTLEILQTPDRVFMFSEWHHDFRMVWTDGRSLPKIDEVEPKWNGYAVGKWEGDEFVVNSLGFDERTWLDHNGYPHTDQMKLEERYKRTGAGTMEFYEVITDPRYYSKPWRSDTKTRTLDPVGTKAWDEQIYCVPSEEFKFNKLVRDAGVGKQ